MPPPEHSIKDNIMIIIGILIVFGMAFGICMKARLDLIR